MGSKGKEQCENEDKDENIGLLFERYLEWEEGRKGLTFVSTKKERLNYIAQMKSTTLSRTVEALGDRCRKLVEFHRQSGYEVRSFEQNPTWRLVVGLGGASVLETSMTLHPVYGLPIVPGSALKGVARAYAEAIKAPQQEIDAVFGPEPKRGEKARAAAGKVIFFDACPTSVPSFEPDIMNVHYADYYSSKGKTPPADYLSPNPILFLTVGKDTQFRFIIAARTKESDAARWVAKAEEWLKGGLKEMGVGAKTMVGYGYFALSGQSQQSSASPRR